MAQETTPERFQRMERIFHRLQQLPAGERAAWLDEWCADDEDMKADVESLLASTDEEEKSSGPPAPRVEQPDAWLGRELGSYRIDSLLGRGGMGAVYLASRTGGDISQNVAIKVMGSRIVSGAMREYFKSERQILASLNHPNIARLLDGGIDSHDELYLVMEYVEGMRLDHYVQRHNPGLSELLTLFLQVCAAVEYAHRNLIVHRDLKPANILVTAEGQAKLLDFGTAKLVDPRSPEERSRFTQLGFRACTPEYASPEQIAGGVASAASDVYSLGVILYQLVTGKLPYETPEGGAYSVVVQDRRPRAPSQIRRGIGADLDAVALKALASLPEERYPSVASFAADLRNVLESRPVSAREQTWSYRALRLLRRRRLEFVGAALALAALGAGLAATIAQMRVARQELVRANQGVQDVRGLTRMLLFDFYDAVRALPGSREVQKSLVTESLTYLDKLQLDAPEDKELAADIVEALIRLGNLQSEDLNEPEAAEQTLRKALALAAGNPRMTALAEGNLGKALVRGGRIQEGGKLLRNAVGALSKPMDSDGADAALLIECASFHRFLGVLSSTSDPSGASAHFTRQTELDRRAVQLEPGSRTARRDLAEAMLNLAGLKRQKEDSLVLLRSGLRVLDEKPDKSGNSTADMRLRASILVRLAAQSGDGGEALRSATEAGKLLASVAALEPLSGKSREDLSAAERIKARLDESGALRPTPR